MAVFTVFMLIGVLVVFVLILAMSVWVSLYLYIYTHALGLKKAGWIVVTKYRLTHAELNAVHPNQGMQYAKLTFSLTNKDEYVGYSDEY